MGGIVKVYLISTLSDARWVAGLDAEISKLYCVDLEGASRHMPPKVRGPRGREQTRASNNCVDREGASTHAPAYEARPPSHGT